ncbi:MAG: intradiol ring-cleavage dioxygenase [Anaerolineaceae bacterium]|nr:intradiol ring-cleavage dioxygenase [Anaerolineae bacterium]MCB9458598.1 intradiol ring-cleavage dioxygenase [Anaerolineaceae bacterium]
MDNDDIPVGRVLSRREALKLFGGAGLAIFASGALSKVVLAQDATATATDVLVTDCVVRPEMTEGPYFVDALLNRMDIRPDPVLDIVKEGVPLKLKLQVYDVTDATCNPLEGVQVDIWQCDAVGTYSGVEDAGFETLDESWLRGYQVTDEFGVVEFLTIYPGWYSGRTVHVHVKIRTDPESEDGYEFTSQFYFNDDLSDMIHAMQPYSEKAGARDTYNDTDMHYNGETGDQMLLTLEEWTEEETGESGYSAVFSIGLDLSDEEVGASDSEDMGAAGGGTPPQGGPGGPPAQSTETSD